MEHRLLLDGRSHSDARWFGGPPRQQTVASLKGATLEIVMLGTSSRDPALVLTPRLTLLADGDLCVVDNTSPNAPFARPVKTRRTALEKTTLQVGPHGAAPCRRRAHWFLGLWLIPTL